jgi:hypothetical protein
MVHVSAEQKRRGHIKVLNDETCLKIHQRVFVDLTRVFLSPQMGLDALVEMVPALASQGSAKISKAVVLKKCKSLSSSTKWKMKFFKVMCFFSCRLHPAS